MPSKVRKEIRRLRKKTHDHLDELQRKLDDPNVSEEEKAEIRKQREAGREHLSVRLNGEQEENGERREKE